MKCLYKKCPGCNKYINASIDGNLINFKCNICNIKIYITIDNECIFDVLYKDYTITTYSNCIIKHQRVRYNFESNILFNYIEGFNFLIKYIDNLIFEI